MHGYSWHESLNAGHECAWHWLQPNGSDCRSEYIACGGYCITPSRWHGHPYLGHGQSGQRSLHFLMLSY